MFKSLKFWMFEWQITTYPDALGVLQRVQPSQALSTFLHASKERRALALLGLFGVEASIHYTL
jgi:hypothetical protein